MFRGPKGPEYLPPTRYRVKPRPQGAVPEQGPNGAPLPSPELGMHKIGSPPGVATVEPTRSAVVHDSDPVTPRPPSSDDPTSTRRSPTTALAVVAVAGVAVLAWVAGRWLDVPAVQAWRTVRVAIVVQAVPFLLLGTALSGAISAFVPARVFSGALPKNRVLAVPVAGMAGMALPGCERTSVPVAGSLIRRGITPSAALAFLLSAPAINPIVLTTTAVAFPGNPEMVLARLPASLGTAVLMG